MLHRTRIIRLSAPAALALCVGALGAHRAHAVVTPLVFTKTASPNPVMAGEPVTYTYVVQNSGGDTLTDVTVTDDAGTPDDPSDDFTVGTIASLAPGETQTLTKVVTPTCMLCNGGDGEDVGTLSSVVLSDGDVLVRFIQSRDVVDNTYGVNASAGWTHGHKFTDLVGSDHAEFRFKNGAGVVVMDFSIDYISKSSAFPSGYGTLGATGGDGKITVGSASDIVSYDTSLTDDLNQSPAFYGYTVDSPAPESAFPTWDYRDAYTVVVRGSAFGSSGFGSVEVPYVHNSPAKTTDVITPTPCDCTVTNLATVTATDTATGTTVSAEASATVQVQAGAGGGGSVTAGAATFDHHEMSLLVTNEGSSTVKLSRLSLQWPSSNHALVKVFVEGATVFDTKTGGTSVTISTWKGHDKDRQIGPGKSVHLRFQFEGDASTNASLYALSCDFGGGFVDFLP